MQLVDQRLRTIFSSDEPVVKTAHAGPGRGKKGKTHKKFSASLEEGLFERAKVASRTILSSSRECSRSVSLCCGRKESGLIRYRDQWIIGIPFK